MKSREKFGIPAAGFLVGFIAYNITKSDVVLAIICCLVAGIFLIRYKSGKGGS